MSEKVRVTLSRIEAVLESVAKGQDEIKDLLKERRPIWDTAAVKVSILITVLSSGAVLVFVGAVVKNLWK